MGLNLSLVHVRLWFVAWFLVLHKLYENADRLFPPTLIIYTRQRIIWCSPSFILDLPSVSFFIGETLVFKRSKLWWFECYIKVLFSASIPAFMFHLDQNLPRSVLPSLIARTKVFSCLKNMIHNCAVQSIFVLYQLI